MATPKSDDEAPSTGSPSAGEDDAWPLETVKATVEAARSDVLFESERMKTLDNKLVSIAAFSGVSLSVSGSVGASVVANGSLSLGFTIALGATLTVAVLLLLIAVLCCFAGL